MQTTNLGVLSWVFSAYKNNGMTATLLVFLTFSFFFSFYNNISLSVLLTPPHSLTQKIILNVAYENCILESGQGNYCFSMNWCHHRKPFIFVSFFAYLLFSQPCQSEPIVGLVKRSPCPTLKRINTSIINALQTILILLKRGNFSSPKKRGKSKNSYHSLKNAFFLLLKQ